MNCQCCVKYIRNSQFTVHTFSHDSIPERDAKIRNSNPFHNSKHTCKYSPLIPSTKSHKCAIWTDASTTRWSDEPKIIVRQ